MFFINSHQSGASVDAMIDLIEQDIKSGDGNSGEEANAKEKLVYSAISVKALEELRPEAASAEKQGSPLDCLFTMLADSVKSGSNHIS